MNNKLQKEATLEQNEDERTKSFRFIFQEVLDFGRMPFSH
jgi:hypothetical protein